jgi:hypothetical protein
MEMDVLTHFANVGEEQRRKVWRIKCHPIVMREN